MSYVYNVEGLSFLVFACLEFVVSGVCLSRVGYGTEYSFYIPSNIFKNTPDH